MTYRGRFAPSPTGPLHLGSLVTAAASFLTARKAKGQWFLRIDDIDPPREEAGASDRIKRQLESFGLAWDGPVFHQADRMDAYQDALVSLRRQGHVYDCSCSRAKIAAHPESDGGRRYPGTCRMGPGRGETAVRVRTDAAHITFEDRLRGRQTVDLEARHGDYVVYRKDRLPAYHLACAMDDHEQGITEVVRGSDLLASTAHHVHLQQLLGLSTPRFAHTPVVVARGTKLSKQAGAAPVSAAKPEQTVLAVLRGLGLPVDQLQSETPPVDRLWQWALQYWDLGALRGRTEIPIENFGPVP